MKLNQSNVINTSQNEELSQIQTGGLMKKLKCKKIRLEPIVEEPTIEPTVEEPTVEEPTIEPAVNESNNKEPSMVDILKSIYYIGHKFMNIDINNDSEFITLLLSHINDINAFNNKGYLGLNNYCNNILNGSIAMKQHNDNSSLLEELTNIKNKQPTENNMKFIEGFIDKEEDEIDEQGKRNEIAKLKKKINLYFDDLYDNNKIASNVPKK